MLKKMSKKKILLCPACGKPYEYCHGEVKIPYFRHMDKAACEDKYSESETEEHLKGKQDLYEWIKCQKDVKNAILEGWLPETKQRPDIMFEYKDKKYVIEYQCSPIATEYIERHELYRVAGIIDIWICGTEKYLKYNMREKYLEANSIGFYNSYSKQILYGKYSPLYKFVQNIKIKNCAVNKVNGYNCEIFLGINLKDTTFIDSNIVPQKYSAVDIDKAIIINNSRAKNHDIQYLCSKKTKLATISNIVDKYCKQNNIDLGIDEYGHIKIMADDIYNVQYKKIDFRKNVYWNLKNISFCFALINKLRKRKRMIDFYNDTLKNKLLGNCHSIDYTSFKDGECVDIIYADYVVRNVIKYSTNMTISIHDYEGYKRRNYQIYNLYNDYLSYENVINDIEKYNNIINNNYVKVMKAIENLKNKYNNNSWKFNFQKSNFNIISISLSPVDDEGYSWESIGDFKINASLDKKIDIANVSVENIESIIIDYYRKRLELFYKRLINGSEYCTSTMRLMCIRREYE